MKVIPLPQTEAKQATKRASLHRATVAYSVAVVVLAVAALLLALGLFISAIVFEFTDRLHSSLLYILIGSFAGGAWISALAAFGLNLLGRKHRAAELDFCERCDGEESFYVGEGTLATFEESGVRIHGERGGHEFTVPYKEMRFFSVCTRRKPKERGEWSVVMEVPAHYLSKSGRPKAGEKPALIQTDHKPRLSETLQRRGLALIGELPAAEQKRGKGAPFTRLKRFDLPDRSKRRRALMSLAMGGTLLVGGVLIAVFWQIVIGALLAAVGFMLGARGAVGFLRAKGSLGVYEEGIYWRDTGRVDSVFLKWEEIDRITPISREGASLYRVECPYGAYHIPAVKGSYEFMKERHPEKFGG